MGMSPKVVIGIFLFPLIAFANESFSPDISLIRQWNDGFYKKHPYQPFPKTILFREIRSGKAVTFVATKHKDWKSSQQKIKASIEREIPEIILIEGIARNDGLSPRIWDDKIKHDLRKEGLEGYYAYKLAVEKNIPFVGAELDGKMSDHTSYERDVAVVTYLANLVNRHNRVLVIYGAGHFVQQELVLTKMLGVPIQVQ